MRFNSARRRNGRSGNRRSPRCRPHQQRCGRRWRGLRWPEMRGSLHHRHDRRKHDQRSRRGHRHHRPLHLQLALRRHCQIHRGCTERRSTARLQRCLERHGRMRQHGQGQQQRPDPSGKVQDKTAQHPIKIGAKSFKNNLSAFRTSSVRCPVRWSRWTAHRQTSRRRTPIPSAHRAQNARRFRSPAVRPSCSPAPLPPRR